MGTLLVTPVPPPSASAFIAMVGVTEAGLDEFRVAYGMLDELRREASPPVESFDFTSDGLDRLGKRLSGCAALLVAPNLRTWSRLPHLNQLGPRPLRSAAHPFGLPNLDVAYADRVNAENGLYQQCLMVTRSFLVSERGANTAAPFILFHPEDLGASRGRRPASPWQLESLKRLAMDHELIRGALQQCRLGPSAQAQPPGFLTNMAPVPGTFKCGWPKLDDETATYLGPLPRNCGCGRRHQSLVRRGKALRTTPPLLKNATITWIAEAMHTKMSQPKAELGHPAERGLILAELLPDLLLHAADDDGYDTDGTIIMEPIFDRAADDAIAED